MIIHIVQPGDTLHSIARAYNISIHKLRLDNGISDPDALSVGQAIVIAHPVQTYTVKNGDTLANIASAHGTTLNQILRNNPFLADRNYTIYPGDTIIISYNGTDKPKITTNGYAYPFIDRNVLRRTLPFLTYLTIFSYQALPDGTFIGIDDEELIEMAKDYGVAPIMVISSFSLAGVNSRETATSILYNEELQDKNIENILAILDEKGYYGLNASIHYINADNLNYYEHYLTKLTTLLNAHGYPVTLTIIPRIFMGIDLTRYDELDYSSVAAAVNNVQIINYDWGYTYGPPMAVSSVNIIRIFLDEIIKQISSEKINLGISFIAYDWESPFVLGVSRGRSLNAEAAVDLAFQVGATIYFDENSLSPYFQYIEKVEGRQLHHIVWFKDARSVDALVRLIPEYGFSGLGVWNIMSYFSQLWLILNIQYEIERIDL